MLCHHAVTGFFVSPHLYLPRNLLLYVPETLPPPVIDFFLSVFLIHLLPLFTGTFVSRWPVSCNMHSLDSMSHLYLSCHWFLYLPLALPLPSLASLFLFNPFIAIIPWYFRLSLLFVLQQAIAGFFISPSSPLSLVYLPLALSPLSLESLFLLDPFIATIHQYFRFSLIMLYSLYSPCIQIKFSEPMCFKGKC